MCRIPQRGWSALPDSEERAKEDDGPRGVFVSPARTVDSSRGCRPAEDTGAVRKSPGPPPPLHGMMNDRWTGMFSSLAEPCESHCPRPFQPSPAFAGEGRQGEQERGGTAGSGVAALLHLTEHVVEVKAGGLLALRILPERLQELPDKGLRRHQKEDVIDKPIVVRDRRDVGTLEGIRAQVEQLWHAQGDEGLGPHFHRARLSLFLEHD